MTFREAKKYLNADGIKFCSVCPNFTCRGMDIAHDIVQKTEEPSSSGKGQSTVHEIRCECGDCGKKWFRRFCVPLEHKR